MLGYLVYAAVLVLGWLQKREKINSASRNLTFSSRTIAELNWLMHNTHGRLENVSAVMYWGNKHG